jgi:predicted MFS family arabinose efflux permease
MKISFRGLIFVAISFLVLLGLRALFGFEIAALWGIGAAATNVKERAT